MATLTSNESNARSLKPRKHETCSSLATDQGTIPPWLLFPTSLDHHKSSFVSGPALLRQLDASKNEIRLIHILPKLSSSSTSRVTEPIQCILSHVSLTTSHIAIHCYTPGRMRHWGKVSRIRIILGHRFPLIHLCFSRENVLQ